jgi:pyruvate/2-oxoglutarate dehydrogenase complex dihydrolipoamide acyltransferase (E2) component
MEQVNRHSQILGPEVAVQEPHQAPARDNGRASQERKPGLLERMLDESKSSQGMPFHWAMAFAFLVFVAMSVAFWCGHYFSVSSLEKFMNKAPMQAPIYQYAPPAAPVPPVQEAPKQQTKAHLDAEAAAALAQVISERLDQRAREQQESLTKVVGSMSNNSTAMQDLTKTFSGELNAVDTKIAAVQTVLQQLRERDQAELDTIQKAVNENSDSTRADLSKLRSEFTERIAALDRSLVALAQVVRTKVQHPDEIKLSNFGMEFPPKESVTK